MASAAARVFWLAARASPTAWPPKRSVRRHCASAGRITHAHLRTSTRNRAVARALRLPSVRDTQRLQVYARRNAPHIRQLWRGIGEAGPASLHGAPGPAQVARARVARGHVRPLRRCRPSRSARTRERTPRCWLPAAVAYGPASEPAHAASSSTQRVRRDADQRKQQSLSQ